MTKSPLSTTCSRSTTSPHPGHHRNSAHNTDFTNIFRLNKDIPLHELYAYVPSAGLFAQPSKPLDQLVYFINSFGFIVLLLGSAWAVYIVELALFYANHLVVLLYGRGIAWDESGPNI